jgi:hypothetical protein
MPDLGEEFLARQDVALARMMQKLGIPNEDVRKGLKLIERLRRLEGGASREALGESTSQLSEAVSRGGAGEAARLADAPVAGVTPPPSAAVGDVPRKPMSVDTQKEIMGLRAQIEELVPEWGFYVPRGSLAKFSTDKNPKLLREMLDGGEITLDEFNGISIILHNDANKAGDQLLQVPHTQLFALRQAARHFDAVIMPAGVAQHMNGHLGSWVNVGEDLAPFIRVFDTIQNWWKAWTLGIFPVYHIRNAIGNVWNSFLGGAHDPETWVDAGHFLDGGRTNIPLLKQTAKSEEDLITKYFSLADADELADIKRLGVYKHIENLAVDQGILNRGEFSADIRQFLEDRLAERTKVSRVPFPLAPSSVPIGLKRDRVTKQFSVKKFQFGRNLALDVGMSLGTRVENHARMALFLDGLQQGMGDVLSAHRVRKLLFDYDDLTAIERNVFRRIFPFYTWTRKNIPLQLRHFVTHPAKFTGGQKAIDAFTDATGLPLDLGVGGRPDERLLPEWMQDQVPVPARKLGDGKFAYFVLGNWIPAADLAKMWDLKALAGGMITPLTKAPLEWATNYSLFFENNIERFPKETGEFLGIRLSKHEIALARNIRFFNQMDKLLFKDDLPVSLRVWQQFFGRTYPVDFNKEKKFRAYTINRESSAIKASIRREREKLRKEKRRGRGGLAGLEGFETAREKTITGVIKELEQELLNLEASRISLGVGSIKKSQRLRKLTGRR